MTRTGRLRVVLVLNLLLLGALVAVGLSAHSLGVLGEGVDYLADAAAIAVSLLAIWLTNRAPTVKHPHGYPKATLVAAAANAVWLLVLSLLVAAGQPVVWSPARMRCTVYRFSLSAASPPG